MIYGLNHLTLAVRDIHRSFEFYAKIMGLKPLVKWDKGAYFLIPGQPSKEEFWFCLNVDENRRPNPCYTHYAFSVSAADFASLSDKITASGATLFKNNVSPGKSLYFLDPDGHKLEIHTGNANERIAAKKANLGSWRDVEWFI